jgi:hypothetical protein
VDKADSNSAENVYYAMSYQLGCTEDNAEVKKVVDEAQEYYDAQEKREWVEWAGKMLMLRLHAQMVIEKVDAARAEQDMMDELRLQEERAQQEEEQAAKEAELDEKEAEYIQQVNMKEIDEDQFRKLVAELDLERVMGESVAEGPAMTQDEEVGESEWDKSVEEEPEAVEKIVKSSTVGKGKWKAAPTRSKVYVEVEGPVSTLLKSSSIHR